MTHEQRAILIVDDHPLFREAIETVLEGLSGDLTLDHAISLAATMKRLAGPQRYDLVMLDLDLSDCSALEGLAEIRANYPNQAIVVVSATETRSVMERCLTFGARGFIPKSSPISDIREAISVILEGERWLPRSANLEIEKPALPLTPTQTRILNGVMHGKLNKQIAFDIGITEATVKAHMTDIFRRLGVSNRTQAVIAARELMPDSQSRETI